MASVIMSKRHGAIVGIRLDQPPDDVFGQIVHPKASFCPMGHVVNK